MTISSTHSLLEDDSNISEIEKRNATSGKEIKSNDYVPLQHILVLLFISVTVIHGYLRF